MGPDAVRRGRGKSGRPASAGWKPVIRLKAVVLPEPFGPMRALTDPSATSKLQPSSARTPPNDLVSPSTASSASSQVPGREDGVRRDLVTHEQAGEDLAGHGPGGGPARERSPPGGGRSQEEQRSVREEVEVTGPEAVGKVLLGGADQGRADDRAPQGAAAEKRHQDRAKRKQRVEGEARVQEGDVVGPHRPKGGGEAGADREGDQFDQFGLYAEPPSAVFVVAHGVEREPELAGPHRPSTPRG